MTFKFNKKTKDKPDDRRHGVFIFSDLEKMNQNDVTWHRCRCFRLICRNKFDMENCATIGQDHTSITAELTDDITYWAMETTSSATSKSIAFRLICRNYVRVEDK